MWRSFEDLFGKGSVSQFMNESQRCFQDTIRLVSTKQVERTWRMALKKRTSFQKICFFISVPTICRALEPLKKATGYMCLMFNHVYIFCLPNTTQIFCCLEENPIFCQIKNVKCSEFSFSPFSSTFFLFFSYGQDLSSLAHVSLLHPFPNWNQNWRLLKKT